MEDQLCHSMYIEPSCIPLYVSTTFYLWVHQLILIAVVQFLTVVNNAAKNICTQLFMEHIFLFFLGRYLWGDLQGYMLSLRLIFQETAKLLKRLYHFIFLTVVYQCSNFSPSCATYFSVFLIIAILWIWRVISVWFWFAFAFL